MLTSYNVLPLLFIVEWTLYLVFGGIDNIKIEIQTVIVWTTYKCFCSLYHRLHGVGAYELWLFFFPITITLFIFVTSWQLSNCHGNENESRLYETGTLKPLVLPCRTTHTRLFPKKHGFSYSYLQVGIPVGWRGSISSMLSADTNGIPNSGPRSTAKSWFSVDAADYLDRGNGQLGLKGKLDLYIESQGESKEDYPLAYLVTAPRFLGYSFNPVSFWYLYSDDLCLKAMILEVNNTFDERRMYFMKRSLDSGVNGESNMENGHATRFTNRWTKDFHVSPFNSRKGFYSLSANNPFAASGAAINVDNTITLSSSKDHAKIVARLYSTDQAIDPFTMTLGSKIYFVLSWWWVGLFTFPRIVKEAGRLFFKRKLHVWFRPEVVRSSIGRKESHREMIVEKCFRLYLKSQAKNQNQSVARDISSLRYIASGANCPREETFALPSQATGSSSPPQKEAILQVLTPLFYTELALHSDPSTFITLTMEQPSERQTCYASPIDEVPTFLEYDPFARIPSDESHLTSLRWVFLRLLRRQSNHALDHFVRSTLSESLADDYRRAVASLLLSSWLTFGIPEILDGIVALFKAALCWLCLEAVWVKATRVIAGVNGQKAISLELGWVIGLIRLWLLGEKLIGATRV